MIKKIVKEHINKKEEENLKELIEALDQKLQDDFKTKFSEYSYTVEALAPLVEFSDNVQDKRDKQLVDNFINQIATSFNKNITNIQKDIETLSNKLILDIINPEQ